MEELSPEFIRELMAVYSVVFINGEMVWLKGVDINGHTGWHLGSMAPPVKELTNYEM